MSPTLPTDAETAAPVRAQKFTGIAVAALALLGLLIALYAAYDRKSIIADGERLAEQYAEQTALVGEGTFESARQLLNAIEVIARPASARKPADPAHTRTALLMLKSQNPHVMDLLVLDANGRIEHWTGLGAPPDVRDRAYYTHHARQSANSLFVGEPLTSKVHEGRWFVALSEAVRDAQGQLRQVAVALVDSNVLHDRLGFRFGVAGSARTLMSESGLVHARRPDHATHIGKRINRPEQFSALTATAPAITFRSVSQLDGQERIISFRKLTGFPLVAAGTVPIESLMAPWQHRLAALAGLWVALAGFAFFAVRRANAISREQANQASIDSLTGISNRRSILSVADRLERTQAHAGSLSLLMVDIDRFKSINDRFGHQIGDQVLRQVSDVLRTQIRTTDIVGRYGGEEFLVLMPDTGPEGALLVAEKLRQSVAERIVQPDRVTVSIGVATTSEKDVTLDRTISRADGALYQAKADGRNRVCVANGEEPAGNGKAKQP